MNKVTEKNREKERKKMISMDWKTDWYWLTSTGKDINELEQRVRSIKKTKVDNEASFRNWFHSKKVNNFLVKWNNLPKILSCLKFLFIFRVFFYKTYLNTDCYKQKYLSIAISTEVEFSKYFMKYSILNCIKK